MDKRATAASKREMLLHCMMRYIELIENIESAVPVRRRPERDGLEEFQSKFLRFRLDEERKEDRA